MKTVAVIPARFASRRFPGKALVPIANEPLVARVARAVLQSGRVDHVIVATDDRRIGAAVADLDVEVSLSHKPFRRGSDRVAATVAAHASASRAEAIVNVQGDEAFVDTDVLGRALEALDGADIGTVGAPLSEREQNLHDVVKVCAAGGRALWFGRGRTPGELGPALAHVGVYAFTREALARFAALPSSAPEVRCDLEQLRALNAGMRIGVRAVRRPHRAINTPEDLELVRRALVTGTWLDGRPVGGLARPSESSFSEAAKPPRGAAA
ncbi:MAG: NTP transferase domain-containing protein [Myxococcales bacterium]|nr:NTP transferase domain-containing protein [Myxococcales bacterium]